MIGWRMDAEAEGGRWGDATGWGEFGGPGEMRLGVGWPKGAVAGSAAAASIVEREQTVSRH